MKAFKVQSFYNKLSPKFAEKVETLLLKNNILKVFKTFEYGCLGFACLIVFLNYNNFKSDAESLRSLMMFSLAGGLILLSNEILKNQEKAMIRLFKRLRMRCCLISVTVVADVVLGKSLGNILTQ